MWESFIPILAKQRQVLCYDLPGHGESSSISTQPSLKTLADQLKALLDELQIDRCTIVGFSLGGMINRRFAMDFPDLVESLVIMSSPHQRTPDEQKLVEQRATESNQGSGVTLDATLQRWFTPEFLDRNTATVKQVANWVVSNRPEFYGQLRMVLATGVKELVNQNPPITAPSLIVTCENDTGSTPAMSFAIAREIKNSRVVIIPRLQHLGLIEEPQAFTPLITEFIENLT